MNDLDLELVNMYIQMKRSGHGRAALEHKIICKDKGHYSAEGLYIEVTPDAADRLLKATEYLVLKSKGRDVYPALALALDELAELSGKRTETDNGDTQINLP